MQIFIYFSSTCFGSYAHLQEQIESLFPRTQPNRNMPVAVHLTTNAHTPQDTELQQGTAQFVFIQAITYMTNHVVFSIRT